MTAAEQFLADADGMMLLSCVRQYELAGRVGVTPKHMNQIFGGKVRLTFDMADRIAEALNLEVDVRLVVRHVERAA